MRELSLKGTGSVKGNVLANFVASALIGLVGLLFVPVYLRFIGIEAYGLVGVFASLQATVSLLDLGFTLTMNRELARCSSDPSIADQAQDLVRTLEVIYWGVALFIGAAIVSLAQVLTQRWITTVALSHHTVQTSVALIGLVIMLQWPFSLYAGGLMGLQKQILLATINATVAIIRGIGAIFVLSYVSASIRAFFVWQLVISLTSTVLVAVFLWRHVPRCSRRPKFRIAQLKRVWRFSAGVGAVGVVGLVLLQTDKLILSRLLDLEHFGYYTLAGAVTAGLYMLVNPVYGAVLPRLTQLAAADNQVALADFYHKSAVTMSVVVAPAVVMLALYSDAILLAWTGNATTAAKTSTLVTLLAIGTGIYGVMHIPWAAQVAHGWTRLTLKVNTAGVVLIVPLIFILTNRYGAEGGAIAWLTLNVGYFVVIPYLMHRHVLRGEWLRWILFDVARPVVPTVLVASVGKVVIQTAIPRMLLVSYLAAVAAAAFCAAVMAVPDMRKSLVAHVTEFGTFPFSVAGYGPRR